MPTEENDGVDLVSVSSVVKGTPVTPQDEDLIKAEVGSLTNFIKVDCDFKLRCEEVDSKCVKSIILKFKYNKPPWKLTYKGVLNIFTILYKSIINKISQDIQINPDSPLPTNVDYWIYLTKYNLTGEKGDYIKIKNIMGFPIIHSDHIFFTDEDGKTLEVNFEKIDIEEYYVSEQKFIFHYPTETRSQRISDSLSTLGRNFTSHLSRTSTDPKVYPDIPSNFSGDKKKQAQKIFDNYSDELTIILDGLTNFFISLQTKEDLLNLFNFTITPNNNNIPNVTTQNSGLLLSFENILSITINGVITPYILDPNQRIPYY